MNCVTVIQFRFQYMLLSFNCFVFTFNCVTYLVQISIPAVIDQLISVNILWLLFCSVLNTYYYCSTDLVLQWIVWPLFIPILNVYSFCSTYLVFHWILLLLFSSALNTYSYFSTDLMLKWIMLSLIGSILNKFCYCSTDLALNRIVWLYSVQFSIYIFIAQMIFCYSELCDPYSVHFSLCSYFSTDLKLLWIMWL